jgi:hypothetical protein
MSKYSKAIKGMKKDYTYSLKQLHDKFGFHPQTVRGWIKEHQLPIIQSRPLWIFSEVLRDHLSKELKKRRFTLELQQFNCLSCKRPQLPLQNKVYFEEVGEMVNLRGICKECTTMMFKPQSKEKLKQITPLFKKISLQELNILWGTNSKQETHLSKNLTSHSNEPTTNSHLQQQEPLFKETES